MRFDVFPVWLSVLGVVPATLLLLGFFGPLVDLHQSLYLVCIASIFGVMLWCIGFGLVMLRWEPSQGIEETRGGLP